MGLLSRHTCRGFSGFGLSGSLASQAQVCHARSCAEYSKPHLRMAFSRVEGTYGNGVPGSMILGCSQNPDSALQSLYRTPKDP